MSRPDRSLPSPPPPPPKPMFVPRTGNRGCCERKIYRSMDSLEALALTRNYYRIVFALLRGSERRPNLPVELVARICQYANFTSPNINKSLSDHRPPPPEIYMVLRTGQISRQELRVLGGVEVLIELKDDSSWVVHPLDHWEKFFIKIHRQGGSSSAGTGPDTSEMVWPYFEPKDPELGYPQNQRSDQFTKAKSRRVIDLSHEIWDFLQPGDQFEVALKGQKWDYPEDNYEVVIRVSNRWEPSPAMLALA